MCVFEILELFYNKKGSDIFGHNIPMEKIYFYVIMGNALSSGPHSIHEEDGEESSSGRCVP